MWSTLEINLFRSEVFGLGRDGWVGTVSAFTFITNTSKELCYGTIKSLTITLIATQMLTQITVGVRGGERIVWLFSV